jgi:Tfp pilus assembly protein PilN
MIRINLLPIGRRPVEEKIRREVLFFVLLVFASLGVMAYYHIGHTREITRITVEKKQVDEEIQRYRRRQNQLKELEKKEQILKQKLKIIDDLRKNRDLLVRVLHELSVRIPSDKMWLNRITQQGNNLNLEGVSRGNETIAQFMEVLAQSPYIDANRVILKQSRQVTIEGYKLKGFNLNCTIVTPAPAKEKSEEGPGEKKGGDQKKPSQSKAA